MSLGYALLDGTEGGCRQEGGSHGEAGVAFLRSPGGTTASLQACLDYCTADTLCMAVEWESAEGSNGPKCEIWLEVPYFAEWKAHHECHIKLRAVPPPSSPPPAPPRPPPGVPPSPPPLPPSITLVVTLGVGGGAAGVLALLVAVLFAVRRTRSRETPATDPSSTK